MDIDTEEYIRGKVLPSSHHGEDKVWSGEIYIYIYIYIWIWIWADMDRCRVSLGEKDSAEYIRETASKSDLDRTMAETKTGVVSCK